MLRSKLAVYAWGPAVGATQFQDISSYIDSLNFTTNAPGGFGTLSGLLRINKPGVPRPQFGLFSRIAVFGQPTYYNPTGYCWLGELVTPAYGFTQADGDYIRLNALGLGNALRDNPNIWTFSGQTPQAIAQNVLTTETTTFKVLNGVISTDGSQLFPDNPAITITQTYDERTTEEVFADTALLAGDYNWGVEADPFQKDTAGFPLGRAFIRKRNLSSVDFTASVAAKDIQSAEFTPTADRAYNQIQIDYTNGTGGVTRARATDARLNGDLSQGSAPFRFRKYLRDLSGMSLVNGTVAQNIANTYLPLFENVTYQGSALLRALRDANGNLIPLWSAQAGYNLFMPEMATSAATLPTGPTQNNNLFWITQTTYREDSSGNQELMVSLGYNPEDPDIRIARLQMAADALSRSNKITNLVQAQGARLQGYYGFDFSNASLGQNVGVGVTFQGLASNVPTSLTLTPIVTTNVTGLTATNINAVGAHIGGTATAAGAGQAVGTYITVGNCLRHVNPETGRVAKHCDGCDREHTDLAIADHAYTHTGHGLHPGATGLAIACPACPAIETYNTALTVADEQHDWPHRAEQARLIRQLMVAVGLAIH